jgi:hypothetical protein
MDYLDTQIDAAHTALQRAEDEARAIEARLIKAGITPPLRRYGAKVDLSKNLTAQGAPAGQRPSSGGVSGLWL